MRYLSASTFLLTTSAVLTLSAPLPLNINLGAYSPALVVGDGAIGFKDGGASVTDLMNTLEGAAANSAIANGAASPALASSAPAEATATQTQDQASTQLLEGMGKNVVTREAIDEDACHLAALEAEIEERDTADGFPDEE